LGDGAGDQDHAQFRPAASSTSAATVRDVRRSMLAFRSVVSVLLRGLMPPIEASGGRDGWWIGEVVVDLAGDVAL
jgi:hypothetical protein